MAGLTRRSHPSPLVRRCSRRAPASASHSQQPSSRFSPFVEKEYFAREKVAREVDWHHPHDLDLLAGSYRHMGKLRKAEELWRESSSIRPVTEANAVSKIDLPEDRPRGATRFGTCTHWHDVLTRTDVA